MPLHLDTHRCDPNLWTLGGQPARPPARDLAAAPHRLPRNGVIVRPTLSFDERGHQPNTVTYGCARRRGDGTPPDRFFPLVEDFIGEGGTLDWPQAWLRPLKPNRASCQNGRHRTATSRSVRCALPNVTLRPGQRQSYILILAVLQTDRMPTNCSQRMVDAMDSREWLNRQAPTGRKKLATLSVRHRRSQTSISWLKWVNVQPILRRLIGNSFLPYHDYGRGGRGWRDLWQDALALLLTEASRCPRDAVREFRGRAHGRQQCDHHRRKAGRIQGRPQQHPARVDGPRRVAAADRPALPGPTGDLDFLLQSKITSRTTSPTGARHSIRRGSPEQGTQLKTGIADAVYRGSILEHLLVQHLTAFLQRRGTQHPPARRGGLERRHGHGAAEQAKALPSRRCTRATCAH